LEAIGAVDSADPKRWFLRVIASKTGKGVAVPVHPEFRKWLEQRPQGVGKAALFPALAGKYTGGKSGLSGQFRRHGQSSCHGARARNCRG
jgi:hypothetical protein